MCILSVYSEIHCTADGTKPGDDSCLSENQACTSNLDHSMNFISNFSITITDIECKLGTAENRTETCLQDEHLSPCSGQGAVQSAWAAVQHSESRASLPTKRHCGFVTAILLDWSQFPSSQKGESWSQIYQGKEQNCLGKKKTPLITGSEGKENCKAVTSITCQSSPLTAADRAAMQTCQINAFLVRYGGKTLW